MSQGDLGLSGMSAAALKAAGQDPGSSPAKPIEFEVDGVHFVAYKRSCFALYRDAVRRTHDDGWLLVWSRPQGAAWRVYAFDRMGLQSVLRDAMNTPAFKSVGRWASTPELLELRPYIVAWPAGVR